MINCWIYILLLATIQLSDADAHHDPNIQQNFQNISRYRRQTPNGSCRIPYNPPNGKYAIQGDDSNTYKEGDYAPEFTAVLNLKCDGTYRPSPPEVVGSFCVSGVWDPSPGICSRTCKSIRSTESTEVKCSYNNLPLKSCDHPVEGTVAQFTCEAFYEESSLENNPYRFCEDGEWDGIPHCYPICGQKHPVGRTNIINGKIAKLGDYPWHVGVYNAQKEYRCGGAIITPRLILSAAHCFTNLATGEVNPKEDYLIAAGKYYRQYSHAQDTLFQYSTVESINVPSRYKGSNLQYQADIAVIVLTKQLILSQSVQPVCVDWGNTFEYQQLTPNNEGVVTGWGYTVEGQNLSDELKELSIPFIPFDQCYDAVPRAFRAYLRQDKICGGYLNSSTSICEGDSGGALAFPKRYTGRYVIRGVVSTSPATIEKQCDSNQYGIYTLVSAHLDFINSVRNARKPNPTTTLPPPTTTPLSAKKCVVPVFMGKSSNRITEDRSYSAFYNPKKYNAGDLVKPGSTLISSCLDDFNTFVYSGCVDGEWNPKPLTNCSDSSLV